MAHASSADWVRRPTRQVSVGGVLIGGGAPVTVQSMTKADTADADAVLAQIAACRDAGAQIIRVAIPGRHVLDGFARICELSPLPVVADIHFDHRLAIEAARLGAAKLRINPGNIGGDDRLGPVVEAAGDAGIPVRVGVNAGSLEADLLDQYGGPTADACAASAFRSVERMTRLGFSDLVVSIKASDVPRTVRANQLFAGNSDLPLHIGITEAGFGESGLIKSAVGLGALLSRGIGDTIRVSLTGSPVDEVRAGRDILKSLGLLSGPELVSCPTCGRCRVDLAGLARQVGALLPEIEDDIVIAVMGCEVNGPGEAREADIGLAAGKDRVTLFRGGAVIRSVPFEQALSALQEELATLRSQRGHE